MIVISTIIVKLIVTNHVAIFSFYSVDATMESGRIGRLVNHSKSNANAETKVYGVNKRPQLWLIAVKDIQPDEELLFNYNETRKSGIEANPWLAT